VTVKYTIICRENNRIYKLIRTLRKHGKVTVKIEVEVSDGRIISRIKRSYDVKIVKHVHV